MSDVNLNSHLSIYNPKDFDSNFSQCLLESAKLANKAVEATADFVKKHPVEVVGTLCLVELCIKNPQIGKAAEEAVEGISARAAVGIDDALMMSRKTLKFPVRVVGQNETFYLDQPASSSISQVYMQARQSVARVKTVDPINNEMKAFNASAFAVTHDGKFITNYHVVKTAAGKLSTNIKLIDRFGKSHSAEIVKLDPLNDLAVIQLERPSANPLFKPLKFGEPMAPGYKTKEKEEVFCFGHPEGSEALVGSVESNVRLRWTGTPYNLRHNSAVLPMNIVGGNSGSPVLNSRAEVVGIVKASPKKDSSLYKSLTIAAPSDFAKELLHGS
jgi:S1-C subfamily serine protease